MTNSEFWILVCKGVKPFEQLLTPLWWEIPIGRTLKPGADSAGGVLELVSYTAHHAGGSMENRGHCGFNLSKREQAEERWERGSVRRTRDVLIKISQIRSKCM